ncbi:hypothetical protein PFISCL1PPCAC_16424, partial [Pristionchus fissidentatus]
SDTTITCPTASKFVANVAQLLLNLFGCCTALLLLRVVQSTQIHPNCKYLLSSWSLGYLSLFIAHARISLMNLEMDDLPVNKMIPHSRSLSIDVSVASQFACALWEISIATERLISAIHPAAYYKSGRKGRVLYPVTALILCLAAVQGYITEVSQHFLAAAVILVIDVCTITINSISVRYCQRRFQSMHGKVSLNARYQVREAHDIASSMQRSYIVCFFFK